VIASLRNAAAWALLVGVGLALLAPVTPLEALAGAALAAVGVLALRGRRRR
jgi:hypothetical protein